MASIDAVSSPLPTTEEVRNSTNALESTKGDPTITTDDFFTLMTAQLINQDPLEPMEDTEYVAQMASFSELEQMTELNENFTDYRHESISIAASAYLDKPVSVNTENGEVTGVVTQVNTTSQDTYLVIDGRTYNLDQLLSVDGQAVSPDPEEDVNDG